VYACAACGLSVVCVFVWHVWIVQCVWFMYVFEFFCFCMLRAYVDVYDVALSFSCVWGRICAALWCTVRVKSRILECVSRFHPYIVYLSQISKYRGLEDR
jgi:hypothetical protein